MYAYIILNSLSTLKLSIVYSLIIRGQIVFDVIYENISLVK